jgi:hypothetical protein
MASTPGINRGECISTKTDFLFRFDPPEPTLFHGKFLKAGTIGRLHELAPK